jgi:hypothetical protein
MKGQASAEFIISIGIMLLVFLSLAGIVSEQFDRYQDMRIEGNALAIIESFAMQVNAVALAGDGAMSSITLPAGIDTDGDYNITIYPSNRIARISYANPGWFQSKDMPLNTAAISGTTEGIRAVVSLRNDNGVVIIG